MNWDMRWCDVKMSSFCRSCELIFAIDHYYHHVFEILDCLSLSLFTRPFFAKNTNRLLCAKLTSNSVRRNLASYSSGVQIQQMDPLLYVCARRNSPPKMPCCHSTLISALFTLCGKQQSARVIYRVFSFRYCECYCWYFSGIHPNTLKALLPFKHASWYSISITNAAAISPVNIGGITFSAFFSSLWPKFIDRI